MAWIPIIFGGLFALAYLFMGIGWLYTYKPYYLVLAVAILVVVIVVGVVVSYHRHHRTKK